MLVAAAACVALAAVAALGALDARSWRDAAGRVDGRVPATRLPGDPVGRALGLEDDLAYRRALRAFAAAPALPAHAASTTARPRHGPSRGPPRGGRRGRRERRSAPRLARERPPRHPRGALVRRRRRAWAVPGRDPRGRAERERQAEPREAPVRILVDFGIRSGGRGLRAAGGGQGAGASPTGTGY